MHRQIGELVCAAEEPERLGAPDTTQQNLFHGVREIDHQAVEGHGAAAAAAVARRTPMATLIQNNVEVCSWVRPCRWTEATPSPPSLNRPRNPVMAKTIPCRPKSSGDKRRASTIAVHI